MKINILTHPQNYADLCKALSEDTWPLVHVGNAKVSLLALIRSQNKQGIMTTKQIEVELEIHESHRTTEDKRPSRAEIDKLWDILGIFPRPDNYMDEEAQAIWEQEALEMLQNIHLAAWQLAEGLKKQGAVDLNAVKKAEQIQEDTDRLARILKKEG